jgi:hypothetical protein
MKTNIFFLFCSLLIGTTLAHGAVIMVSPGQSIQAAVNSASSGDTIRISEGVYSENITISVKSLSLVVQPGDSVQVNNITASNPNTVQRSVYLKNLRIQGDVIGTSHDFNIQNCNITGDVNVDQGSLTIIKSNIGANLSLNHSQRLGNPTQAQIFQTTIPEKLTCRAGKSIIGYNTIRNAFIEGNSKILGNDFDGNSLFGIGIDVNGSHTYARIQNNRISGYNVSNEANFDSKCIGIRITGNAKADITNNIVSDCYDSHGPGTEYKSGIGIFVESTNGATIIGNAIWSCFIKDGTGNSPGNRLVWAPFANVVFKNNFLWRSSHLQDANNYGFGGGVESVGNIFEPNVNASPFIDKANGNFLPSANSPLINAGSPLPQYNDRDGSRNDIGMFGGHNFIPDGKTTNKPIVLGLDAAPTFVPIGGTVTIESTGATVK